MSDHVDRHTTTTTTTNSGGNSGLAFIVGILVAVVALLGWVMLSDGGSGTSGGDDVSITIEGAGDAVEGAAAAVEGAAESASGGEAAASE